MVLEHFRILACAVTPKPRTLTQRGLSTTSQGALRDAGASQGPPKSVPRPPGPGIVLYTKRPVVLPHLARASRKVARPSRRARNMPLPKTMDFPSHCMRSCSAGANRGKSLGPKLLSRSENHAAMAVKPSEKPCAPAVSQLKTAYKCCFQASQPTVHSSCAIFVKRRESSQKPCAPGVSLLLGRLYTAWGDFLPLPCFAVCRRGWANFTPGGSR